MVRKAWTWSCLSDLGDLITHWPLKKISASVAFSAIPIVLEVLGERNSESWRERGPVIGPEPCCSSTPYSHLDPVVSDVP